MANTSLRSRLRRLFSTNVIVRRVGKKRLKVVDSNKLQSWGNMQQSKYIDRFSGIHTRNPGWSTYNNSANYHQNRVELYTDYEAMDLDPILSSALDIYADESTVKDTDGDTLTITSPNDNIRKILRNLFYDVLNIEYNLWPWIRNACKYGDFYLHLDIDEDIGIVNVIPLSAYEIRREEMFDEKNPYAIKFFYEGLNNIGGVGQGGQMSEFDPFEIAHFRLLSDTNFLPYGKSMMEGARKVYKQLTLMEDAMLLHRIMRAPERRIFKIDVGNIPPNEVDSHMQTIINKMKKVPYIDETTGDYNLKFNLQNMLEDYYLPVRGGESGTAIEALPGTSNDGAVEDIDYLRNKMHAALRIPKAFLGYDEGVEGKSTLAAEDIRFARTIERIQKIFTSELTKIAIVHLFSQGFTDEDLVNFELTLTSPSIVYEKQKVELMNEKLGLVSNFKETGMFSERYVYENIFNMSQDEWQREQEQVIEDLKEEFRKEQIKSEGNDPQKTNQSFGTPHDIAAMHTAAGSDIPGQQDEGADNPVAGPGRPKEFGAWGRSKSDYGRDALGSKGLDTALKPDETPLSTESIAFANFLSQRGKTSKVLKDSLITEKEDRDKGTMLDEDVLIQEEKA